VFARIAPRGVVNKSGSKLVVCIMTAYLLNLSFYSPSSINNSTAGPTENAVVTVIAPFGIQQRPTKIASHIL